MANKIINFIKKYLKKTPRYRVVLWGIIITSISLIFLLDILITDTFIYDFDIFFGLLLVSLPLFCILIITSKKYYNWAALLILMYFFGQSSASKLFFILISDYTYSFFSLFVLRLFDLLIPIIIFFLLIALAFKAFIVLKHNIFLKWLVFFAGIIFAYFIAFSFIFSVDVNVGKYLSEYWIINHSINLSLIIISLTLIFKLPGINFSSWITLDRRIFYRLILIPLVLIFSFNILFNVFPETYAKLFTQDRTTHPWGMGSQEIEIFDLEGID